MHVVQMPRERFECSGLVFIYVFCFVPKGALTSSCFCHGRPSTRYLLRPECAQSFLLYICVALPHRALSCCLGLLEKTTIDIRLLVIVSKKLTLSCFQLISSRLQEEWKQSLDLSDGKLYHHIFLFPLGRWCLFSWLLHLLLF